MNNVKHKKGTTMAQTSLTNKKFRETETYRNLVHESLNTFREHPEFATITLYYYFSSYTKERISHKERIVPAANYHPTAEETAYWTPINVQLYEYLDKWYTTICKYTTEVVAEKILNGLLTATCTGKYIDCEKIFTSGPYRRAIDSCIRHIGSINYIRMLIRQQVHETFIYSARITKPIPEDIVKLFVANQVGETSAAKSRYWYGCCTLAQFYYNRTLLKYALNELLEACKVENIPGHPSLAAGAITHFNHRYLPLIMLKSESVTNAIAAATDVVDTIEKLISLCVDTRKMLIAIPNSYDELQKTISIKAMRIRHDLAVAQYNAVLAERRVQNAGHRAAQARQKDIEAAKLLIPIPKYDFTPAEYHTDDYDIILPATRQEMLDEGAAMHNCVGTYAADHADMCGTEYMFIVFVREKNGNRFATIEVRYNTSFKCYKIIQCYKAFNKEDDRSKAVKIAYTKFLNGMHVKTLQTIERASNEYLMDDGNRYKYIWSSPDRLFEDTETGEIYPILMMYTDSNKNSCYLVQTF